VFAPTVFTASCTGRIYIGDRKLKVTERAKVGLWSTLALNKVKKTLKKVGRIIVTFSLISFDSLNPSFRCPQENLLQKA